MSRCADKMVLNPIRIKSLLSARITLILFRMDLNKTKIKREFERARFWEEIVLVEE
jgi:hypothetical protein